MVWSGRWLRILLLIAVISRFGSWTEAIEFDRIEKNIIYFKSSGSNPAKSVRMELNDLKYLGQLNATDHASAFLFSGKPTENRGQDIGIYLVRLVKSVGLETETTTPFIYPGKILDPKSRTVVLDSRAFYGRCLAGKGDVFVVFQKERIDRRRNFQASVFAAELKGDQILETLIERRLPSLQETLRRVRLKNCHEISGRNRMILKKPLDLTPRHVPEDDEEDTREGEAPEEQD